MFPHCPRLSAQLDVPMSAISLTLHMYCRPIVCVFLIVFHFLRSAVGAIFQPCRTYFNFGVICGFLPFAATAKGAIVNSVNSGVTGPNVIKIVRNVEKFILFNLLKSELRYNFICSICWAHSMGP